MIIYPTIHEALSPKNETIFFVTDSTGAPRLCYDKKLGYFLPVIPLDADLESLMKGSNWEVKEAIARHPRVTPEILLKLSKTQYTAVKRAALRNPAFPQGATTPSKLSKVA
jgi:hypothetical protein